MKILSVLELVLIEPTQPWIFTSETTKHQTRLCWVSHGSDSMDYSIFEIVDAQSKLLIFSVNTELLTDVTKCMNITIECWVFFQAIGSLSFFFCPFFFSSSRKQFFSQKSFQYDE